MQEPFFPSENHPVRAESAALFTYSTFSLKRSCRTAGMIFRYDSLMGCWFARRTSYFKLVLPNPTSTRAIFGAVQRHTISWVTDNVNALTGPEVRLPREYHESFERAYFPDLVHDDNATIHKDTVYSQFSSHLLMFRLHARMVINAFLGLLLNVKTLNQVCKEITEEPALSPENRSKLMFGLL